MTTIMSLLAGSLRGAAVCLVICGSALPLALAATEICVPETCCCAEERAADSLPGEVWLEGQDPCGCHADSPSSPSPHDPLNWVKVTESVRLASFPSVVVAVIPPTRGVDGGMVLSFDRGVGIPPPRTLSCARLI